MSEVQVAGGLDRLPWLADEPSRRPTPPKRRDLIIPWALASVLLVAGVSFWVGSRSEVSQTPGPSSIARPSATVAVPQARPAPSTEVRVTPQPQVTPLPAPLVRQAPIREIHIAPPSVRRVAIEDVVKQVTAEHQAEKPVAAAPQAKPAAPAADLTPWPPRVTAGAYGRLVQIGAYGSRIQAKRGWAAMVRAYPAVSHLRAVVVETRNSRGRSFYRFQIGTTSQAHSEVLCQRMQKIDLSCAIIGLPWKAKIER
jgi:hypothetical protein